MHNKHIELTKIIVGEILTFYSMSDINQLPPVAIKFITDDSNPNEPCSVDDFEIIAFSEFMDPPNQLKTITFTFHMTNVVRQKDEEFENIFSLMRNGILINEKCVFLINCLLSKINKKNKCIFNEDIHLVTQWKYIIDPNIKYLNMLRIPVVKNIPQYSTFITSKGANHCLKEFNFPKITALNVGCKFMLLINEIKEYKLVNGSIGIVKEMIFEHRDGLRHIPYELAVCVIIDLKNALFVEGTKRAN